ncbi:MAG: ester cyclase [Bacteroidota bacterium]|nr:ester cyclase [Bacteroidota bacterium]MDP4192542.1 ester cyclase [Bacteroidota bacterium]MDP4194445.1 ester cyclase [Bacteroidota bacterium]
MSVQDNIRLVKSHYEAVNHNDFDAGAMLVDKNFEWTNVPMNLKKRGQNGYKEFLGLWFTALPDAKVDIKNIQANEEWVIVEFSGKGTNSGPFNSPDGQIMPTGKHVELQFCELFQIKNGKIVKGKLYFDTASLMKQLGIVPDLKSQNA